MLLKCNHYYRSAKPKKIQKPDVYAFMFYSCGASVFHHKVLVTYVPAYVKQEKYLYILHY